MNSDAPKGQGAHALIFTLFRALTEESAFGHFAMNFIFCAIFPLTVSRKGHDRLGIS